jgi:hypothetical protein
MNSSNIILIQNYGISGGLTDISNNMFSIANSSINIEYTNTTLGLNNTWLGKNTFKGDISFINTNSSINASNAINLSSGSVNISGGIVNISGGSISLGSTNIVLPNIQPQKKNNVVFFDTATRALSYGTATSFSDDVSFNNANTQINSTSVIGLSGGTVNISGGTVNISGGNVNIKGPASFGSALSGTGWSIGGTGNATFNNASTQISSTGVVGLSGGVVNISGGVVNIGGGNAIINGNVGIGTMSPAYKLDVSGHIATRNGSFYTSVGDARYTSEGSNTTYINNDKSGGNLRINTGSPNSNVIIDNGRLGIGMAIPSNTLDISGGLTITNNYGFGFGTDTQTIYLNNNQLSGFVSGQTLSSKVKLLGANQGGSIVGYNTWGTHQGLIFNTNSGSDIERMRIMSNGNVGIGTATPSTELHVSSGKTNTPTVISVFNQAAGPNSGSDFSTAELRLGSSNGSYYTSIRNSYPAGVAGADVQRLDFCTPQGTNNNNQTVRMSITRDGNVGIGTTSPSAFLHLNRYIAPNVTQTEFKTSHDSIWDLRLDSHHIAGDRIKYYLRQNFYNSLKEVISFDEGNVGFGKTDPKEKLDVNGNIILRNGVYYLNNGNYNHWISMNLNSLNIVSKGDTIYGGINFYGYDGTRRIASIFNLNDNFKNSTLSIGQHNYIGEYSDTTTYGAVRSTNSLVFQSYRDALSGSGKIGAKIVSENMQTYSETTGRWKIQSCNLKFYTAPPNVPGYDDTALRMTIADNGYVGIGTSSPAYPLHVTTVAYFSSPYSSSTWSNSGYYGSDNYWKLGTTQFSEMTAYFDSYVASKGYVAFSDKRIKNNIVDIDDAKALQTLRLIKPKTYEYVDKLQRGNENVIGFIAQEIREIIPKAVTITKDYIPNFYTLCQVSATDVSNIVLVTSPIDLSWNPLHGSANASNASDQSGNAFVDVNGNACSDASGNKVFKVKLYDQKNKEIICKTKDILDKRSFLMDITETTLLDASGNVVLEKDGGYFLYGQEVDDFHNIDKQAIFTVVTAAVQDIDRIVQAQAGQIQESQTQIQAQNVQIQDQANQVQDLKSKVAKLEQQNLSFQSQTLSLQSEIMILQNQNASLQSQIQSQIQSQTASLQSETATLKQQIAAILAKLGL